MKSGEGKLLKFIVCVLVFQFHFGATERTVADYKFVCRV